jgi:hypothetical protein
MKPRDDELDRFIETHITPVDGPPDVGHMFREYEANHPRQPRAVDQAPGPPQILYGRDLHEAACRALLRDLTNLERRARSIAGVGALLAQARELVEKRLADLLRSAEIIPLRSP